MMTATHISYPKSGMRIGINVTPVSSYAFDAHVPQVDEPETETTNPVGNTGLVVPCAGSTIELFPIGGNDDDDDFWMHITLWRKIAGSTPLWVPYKAGVVACVVSAALNGVTGSPMGTTEMFCDAATDPASTWDTNIVSARSYGNDQLASVRVVTVGYDLIQIEWDSGAGFVGADYCNVAYSIR